VKLRMIHGEYPRGQLWEAVVIFDEHLISFMLRDAERSSAPSGGPGEGSLA